MRDEDEMLLDAKEEQAEAQSMTEEREMRGMLKG